MMYKPKDGILNVGKLKYICTHRPPFYPDSPHLYFGAVMTWEPDGPDVSGPPISGYIKTYYKGKIVVALLYSLEDSSYQGIKGDKVLSFISEGRISNDTLVVLKDRDNDIISEIESFESSLDFVFFVSSITKSI